MNTLGFSTGNQPLLSQRIFALVAFVLTLIAGATYQNGVNQALFGQINTLSQQFINDQLLIHITEFGNGTLIGIILLLLAIVHSDITKRVLFAVLFSGISIYGLKTLFSLPRPPAVLGIDALHIVGEPVLTDSFPSGHSATAFLMAGLLWLTYRIRRCVGFGLAWPLSSPFHG